MDKVITGFHEWWGGCYSEIDHVQNLLATNLSDAPAELALQLIEIEGWHGRMTTLLAEANSYLDLAERVALDERDESWTDLDRKVNLRAAVHEERRIRDVIDGIAEAIRLRLMLGMSLTKASTHERILSRPPA